MIMYSNISSIAIEEQMRQYRECVKKSPTVRRGSK